MSSSCINGVVGLIFFICTIYSVTCPVFAAYCVTPTEESLTVDKCLPFTPSHYISALLGHDTIADTWHCSATCHDPWNPHDELSLRLEMERWIRANRTVGMFPEAYQFVKDELMRLTNNLHGDTENPQGVTHIRATLANATLADMPWLLVSNKTLRKAHLYYHRYVQQRPIVRVLHLTKDTGTPDMIYNYLRRVSDWWTETERRVVQDPRATVPFLPRISLDQLVGPALSSTDPATLEWLSRRNWTSTPIKGRKYPKHRQFLLTPSRIPLPTALVYYYKEDCAVCEVFGVAFDILPLLYRRLCGYGHVSIVSCSPLVIFIRSGVGTVPRKVPTLMLHGLQLPSTVQVPAYFPVILDVLALLIVNDSFDGVEASLGYQPQVVEVLVKILLRMVDWDMVEPRRLSAAEAAQYALEEKMAAQEMSQSFTNTSNMTNINSTTAATEGVGKGEGGENHSLADLKQKMMNRTRRRRNVVTLESELRRLVTFHLKELWGNSSAKVESMAPLSSSMSEPQWFKAMCALLTVLWFVLMIWKPGNVNSEGRQGQTEYEGWVGYEEERVTHK
ncbi:uncharacterized protein TM35_000044900 [Trypanosoma theileri]|uniref:Transmembrane protein n=1 Tax=Trypanosoma theileri TaxID=67003 RepID=A0A1X0P5R1_9TRYP|nr:uncharacterized protein TM35_000044900 [Trypanosoma theileri]ORC92276.1 hypothetical protein TM35_000044900 [Trypanosoma theileri]